MEVSVKRGILKMRRITGILAGIFLFLGVVALLYHPLLTWISQHNMEREITVFDQVIESAQSQVSEEETESSSAYQNLLEDMQNYNKKLYESGQSGLTDAWNYEQAAFDFTEYGLSTDIPAMGEELPVYLGATKENMAKGVAILGQTSMPVGGTNTNCVIAGHRGYNGIAFFREIEKLQPGDYVYLTTYWGEKTYQVESTAVILPDDIEAILIQEDRELLTLVTCHPYVEATHRYIVYCTAIDTGASDNEPISGVQNSDEVASDTAHSVDWEQAGNSSSQRRIQLEQWLPFLAIPLVVLSIVILIWPPKKEKSCQERRQDKNEKNTP